MSNVRLRRLTADYQKLQEYARLHPRVTLLQAEGDPPERYQLQYRIRSLRMINGELEQVKDHTVEIVLPRNYPRTPPQCRMLSPVFHPNIAPHAICVGDHWSAGESLQSIVTRIGEMLAYQSYNVKSPLNGEAARWVEENRDRLPLDPVSLLADEKSLRTDAPSASRARRPAGVSAGGARSSSSPSAGTSDNSEPILLKPAPEEKFQMNCPMCQTAYSVKSSMAGRKVRCKKCMSVFEITPPESAP